MFFFQPWVIKGRDAKAYQSTKVMIVLLFLMLYSKEVLPGPWIGSLRKDDRFWHSKFEKKSLVFFFFCVFCFNKNAMKWYVHFYLPIHSTFKSQWRNQIFFMAFVGFKINRGVVFSQWAPINSNGDPGSFPYIRIAHLVLAQANELHKPWLSHKMKRP